MEGKTIIKINIKKHTDEILKEQGVEGMEGWAGLGVELRG